MNIFLQTIQYLTKKKKKKKTVKDVDESKLISDVHIWTPTRRWLSRLGLQNTAGSLQRGKTLPTGVLDMTLNYLMVRLH